MRFVSIIFLTLVICFQPFQGFFTIINWKLNQAEITDKFCVNKAKMNMHCNGKCYLSKQLKLQEDEQQADLSKKNLPKLKKLKVIEFYTELEFVEVPTTLTFELQNNHHSEINLNYVSKDVNLCFQPPEFY